MRPAEYQRANPERQLAWARETCGQDRIYPGVGRVDDQTAAAIATCSARISYVPYSVK